MAPMAPPKYVPDFCQIFAVKTNFCSSEEADTYFNMFAVTKRAEAYRVCAMVTALQDLYI